MSFSDLKNSRKNSIDNLVAKAEVLSGTGEGGKKSYVDERIWKPTVDKSGNGYAVIRFLPPVDGEDIPWVRYWDHFFKGPTGQWYVEKSLTTIGQNDPVSEMNSQLWNSGLEEDKQTARDRKRRQHFVSNIYVISDPGNPENEGKVFLYQYGKKIFDKIMDMMKPEFVDEEPVNPFDFWEGADFKLKIRQVEGYRNYDKSEFAVPSPFLGADDDKLKEVYDSMYPLYEYIDPKTFKSYDELKARLHRVLGMESGASGSAQMEMAEESAPSAPRAPAPEAPATEAPAAPAVEDDDDDDTLSYFAKLAEQD